MSRFTTVEFPSMGGYVVHVEVARNLKAAMRKYKHTKSIEPRKECTAITVHVCGENLSFIFMRPSPSVDTIAHESWHAVHRMFEHYGAELESECVAYSLGYLAGKIHGFVYHKGRRHARNR